MNLQTVTKGILVLLAAFVLLAMPPAAIGGTAEKGKKEQKDEQKGDEKGRSIQRVPRSAYEVLQNKVSKIEFYTSNYGIFGLNVAANRAGGIWPRGSSNAYIFGGGIWFGCKKIRGEDTNKLCVIGYNPNSGASWMVPGPIVGDNLLKQPLDETPDGINKNRLYFASDYNKFTGEPFDKADVSGPYWPIWDASESDVLKNDRYFGYYIENTNDRNRATYHKGPAMISQEDIFSIYRDTDLGKYEKISRDTAKKKGYPIGIQVEQTIYTWGFGTYGNFLFIKYNIINRSGENLLNCFMAPALDMDIGNAGNDHATIAIPSKDEDTLNLAIQWSESEAGKKFGYIGFDFLESPAVDDRGYVRHDKRVFTGKEQVGLSVFQNWPIEEDPQTPEQRYEFISDLSQRDVDIGPGDRRFLFSTGPFNMAPGDTARVVVGIMFAYGNGDVPTGQEADRRNIYAIDTFAQKVYDENFKAPEPPDPAHASWTALNGGVKLSWDEASERSLDFQERGLDFGGYTIKRARRTVGFPLADSTDGWNLGFKTIGGFVLPPLPDTLTRMVAARSNDLSVLGAWWRLPMLADTTIGMRLTSAKKFRVDTLKRPGLPDQIVVSKDSIGLYYYAQFPFDPYDDVNNDSSIYNSRNFPGFADTKFKNKALRDIVRDAIADVMDSITDGRTFIDIGDDNGDGQILDNTADLTQNERLINNVDYYYQVLAYDAGSREDETPSKSNTGIVGLNEVRATPEAIAAGPSVVPKVISSDGMGGVHNFRFNVLDNQRLQQLFAGDTIDFVWEPVNPTVFLDKAIRDAGSYIPHYFYVDRVTAYSRKKGGVLMSFAVPWGDFSDRAPDTLPKGLLDSGFVTRKGGFNARNVSVPYNLSFDADPLRPLYSTVGQYKNTFNVGFDYSLIQFGDSLRPGVFGDTTLQRSPFNATSPGGGNTNLGIGEAFYGQFAGIPNITPLLQQIPSIGQPKLEVSFSEGGTEDVTVTTNRGKQYRLTLNYLNMKVRNIATFKRQVYDGNGQLQDVEVAYDYEFPYDQSAQVKADTTSSSVGLARVIDRGKWGAYAYGWMNADKADSATRYSQFKRGGLFVGVPAYKSYIGTPGRYYTGTYTLPGTDTTLRFTHSLVVNGQEVFIDHAGMGSSAPRYVRSNMPATPPSKDFAAGDKFTVDFTGGTMGLPQPGGKISVAIPSVKPAVDQYTDDLLDQVSIVPNPYLVAHIGQATNTDRRLYFTRLPERCTIQLYTENGELLQTLEHDVNAPGGENGRVAVEVWDLLTKANRQAQSQLIIARITTPNGAETIKKVAIVVGGFRLNNR